MITHIQGKLTEKNPTDVVIDCNGVGLRQIVQTGRINTGEEAVVSQYEILD